MLAAVGEQSDKPLVSTFLGAEGVPELLRVPDVAGSTRRPRLGAVVPRRRGRGPRPGPRRRVRRVAAHAATATAGDPDEVDRDAGASGWSTSVLMEPPRGPRPRLRRAAPSCSAAYGIELWDAAPVGDSSEATAAGEALGWDVVLKATAEHLRERPDLAHVWRNIDDADGDARRLGARSTSSSTDARATPASWCRRTRRPACPVAIGAIEDPLFGPVVSFGISGPLTELLGDRSYRIPPLGRARRRGRWCARSRPRRCCSATAAARSSTSTEIERLIRRVAQLQNDLPQVRSLELSLVLAGADGVDRARRRRPGRAGRSTRGRTGSCAGCRTMPGDTLPD